MFYTNKHPAPMTQLKSKKELYFELQCYLMFKSYSYKLQVDLDNTAIAKTFFI